MKESGKKIRVVVGIIIGLLILIIIGLGIYWSQEPARFNVYEHAKANAQANNETMVVGYTMTNTLIEIASTLLNKQGGYITNDVMPPGVMLDNISNWEFGVLVQVRDLSRALRKDFSRSQSQSEEDKDLVLAEPLFNFSSDSWVLPASESQYEKGIKALRRYQHRITEQGAEDAQFYARADNLSNWFSDIETRLGSLSQRLSASVVNIQVDASLTGDSTAKQSTPVSDEELVKTPWTEIDDVFYEARGTSWALILLLKAVEVDFHDTLERKNALVSLQKIIRELEGTQTPLSSPVILNGSGFGFFANHSLVMNSYISRVNTAIINLRELLIQG